MGNEGRGLLGSIVYILASGAVLAGGRLAILPVKEVANRLPPGCVRFTVSLEGIAVPAALGDGSTSGALHSGQRLAKPGLSGFSSNSSEQIAQTLIGKAISTP